MSEYDEESPYYQLNGPRPEIEIIDGKIQMKNNKKKEIQPTPIIIPQGAHKRLLCDECEVNHREQWKKIQMVEYENGTSYVDERFTIGWLCIECNTKKNKRKKDNQDKDQEQ